MKNEIERFWTDEQSTLPELTTDFNVGAEQTTKFSDKKIFIIHGHDEAIKEKVARFLEKLDLVPIILHEKPNEGKTIIEKFEKHSLDAGYAIALLTPDDVGRSSTDSQLNYRARQNIILELGFFMGKLGRNRVCNLVDKDIEVPSDYSGILYISLNGEEWKFKLVKELKTAGFKIDTNKL